MTIVFTKHAESQLRERQLSKVAVSNSIKNPTIIKRQQDGRLQFIKLFKDKGKPFLLVSIVEKSSNTLVIITIFKTSKIKKYL